MSPGLKYAQIENFLKSHIGRIYQNFDLNVTMGELRSIDIYVVGQVCSPRPVHRQLAEHSDQCDLCLRRALAARLDAGNPVEARGKVVTDVRPVRSAAQRRQEQRRRSAAGGRHLRRAGGSPSRHGWASQCAGGVRTQDGNQAFGGDPAGRRPYQYRLRGQGLYRAYRGPPSAQC